MKELSDLILEAKSFKDLQLLVIENLKVEREEYLEAERIDEEFWEDQGRYGVGSDVGA